MIEVKNLSIASKKKNIVKNISFTIRDNDTLAIIGESGSGKSLTALAILGFLDNGLKATGSVLYDEKNLLTLSEAEWRPLRKTVTSIVLQNPMTSLNPTMNIGEQILEAIPENDEQKKEIVFALLKEVEVPHSDCFSRYPHHYSGGQRQRIAIAIALASRPKLLIADEPTTALDVTVQKQIMQLLKRLQEKHQFSLVLITHDLPLAKQMCNSTIVMYHGEILEIGTTEQLLKSPKHPYTFSLIESYHSLTTGEIHVHLGKKVYAYDKGCPFSLRCPFSMNICPEEKPTIREKCWLYDERGNTQKRKFDEAASCM